MCGIFGIWNLEREAVDLGKLQLATDAIRHRGPDDEGYLLVNTRTARAVSCGGSDTDNRLTLPELDRFKSEHFDLVFGFRRLAILDLSPTGHQPMSSPDGKFWTIFNGEIYNYRELRAQLKDEHKFQTTSDTEVVLAAYQQWGESCVEHFNGMFALAIWDTVTKKLFIARDRFGEKPLYYIHVPNRLFAFASEMKALWAAGVAGRAVHEETLALFTHYGEVETGEQTIYKNILRLPQAHSLILTSGRVEKRRYWDIDPRVRIDDWTDERYVEQFRELLSSSVSLRLHADVPVGSSLSGGLDSSTIVGVINRLLPESSLQKTFSARFDDPSRDEGKWMDLVTQRNRVERHDVWPTAERFFEELSDVFWHQEEPFSSTSVYAQWSVMRLAKEQNDVTVLLDGQGADEMLAGYHSYFNEITDDLLNSLNLPGYLRWRKDCLSLHGVVPGSFSRVFRHKMPARMKKFLKKGLRETPALSQVEPSNPIYPREFAKVSSLRKLLWWNTTRQGLVELLRYADRNSMAHSREVRLPFLDHRFVEFVFKLPDRFLIRDGWTKWILRESFLDCVPAKISRRVDKLGYMPPQQRWLSELVWQDVMVDQLSKLSNPGASQPSHKPELELVGRHL